MQNPFRKAASPVSEAAQALKSWGIKYEKKPDGSLYVPGNLDISNKDLTKLPDLSSVSVGGSFYCYDNRLITLAGAPQTVGGGFWCFRNRLTSLAGAPRTVGDGFYCDNNQLTSLEYAPQSIGGDFFFCTYNQLTSLEGAPRTFKKLASDFGEFSSWDEIPVEFRVSPETKARRESDFVEVATVLQEEIKVRRPLQLRKPVP